MTGFPAVKEEWIMDNGCSDWKRTTRSTVARRCARTCSQTTYQQSTQRD